MKKVLVLSYFFPPCNLTASQRAFSWAKYLNKFGWFPVVVTRRWDNKIHKLSDVSKATPSEILHEKHEGYEVYYLPYKPNLRDKIYVRYGEQSLSGIRRLLTFFELIFQYFFNTAIPYNNLFVFAQNLAKEDPCIKAAIISGNPFNQFILGYTLHNRLGLKWIADYRDAWTTSEINFMNRSKVFQWLNVLDTFFEKKWVSTASFVTASSLPIAQSISSVTGVKSKALYNGFIAEDFAGIAANKYKEFTVTYVGTLYHGQKVEIFCEAFKKLILQNPGIKAKLLFPGLSFYKEQSDRIKAVMTGFENYVECTNRMERKNVLEIECRSHLLLHVAWDEQKGIIASKIYEYIASGTPIIVTPGDKGSIQEIIELSGCGICTFGVDDTFQVLENEYRNFVNGVIKVNETESARVQQFSREQQTKMLAETLNSL